MLVLEEHSKLEDGINHLKPHMAMINQLFAVVVKAEIEFKALIQETKKTKGENERLNMELRASEANVERIMAQSAYTTEALAHAHQALQTVAQCATGALPAPPPPTPPTPGKEQDPLIGTKPSTKATQPLLASKPLSYAGALKLPPLRPLLPSKPPPRPSPPIMERAERLPIVPRGVHNRYITFFEGDKETVVNLQNPVETGDSISFGSDYGPCTFEPTSTKTFEKSGTTHHYYRLTMEDGQVFEVESLTSLLGAHTNRRASRSCGGSGGGQKRRGNKSSPNLAIIVQALAALAGGGRI